MSFFQNPGNTQPNPSTAGSLFGNTPAATSATNTAAPGGGIFGTATNTITPPTGSLFGGTASAAPATGGSLFGGAQATPAAASSGGIFGNAPNNTSASGGGLFGKTNSAPAAPAGGLFGTTSNATPTLGTGGLFGSNPATTATPTATNTTTPSTNPLLSAFGQTKPAEQNGAAPKPTSIFGQPSTNASAGGSTTTTTGSLFGAASQPTDGAASTATSSAPASAPSGGLFSGGLFGKKPDAPTSTAPTATAAATSTLPGFNLGGNKDTSASSATPASGSSSATTTGGLFSLGANKDAIKPEEKKDGAASASTFGLFGGPKTDATKKDTAAAGAALGGDKPKDASTSVAPAASTSITSTAISVPPPSILRGKTIEEIVNRWTTELDTHVREFNQFATEVAVWDRALIENSNNLAALYGAVLAAEREQTDIDQSLDHIEQQQKDLSSTLEAYEKLTDEILGGQGGNLRALDTGPADTERDKNYILATELHGHLDDLSTSLTQMIESVNELSLASDEKASDDPMGQIAQILSSHLESLQWIDGAVREVETKVGDVEKRIRASEGGNASGGGTKSRGFGVVGR